MIKQNTLVAGAAILTSLIANLAYAQEPTKVHIPDQTIRIRTWEKPNLIGIIQDGGYAGVHFLAEPDASTPLQPAYQPKNLLTKLDPSLQVEGVGMPGADSPMNTLEIYSALPNTMFRLKSLISGDGQTAVMLEERALVVFVTGYKTTGSRMYSLDDVINRRFEKDKHVFISDYVVSIADLPPCDTLAPRLCETQK